jgi:cellulose synthase/poly-beta-1,6-N-acetylglucosamine synthase-like glycosyltransferase
LVPAWNEAAVIGSSIDRLLLLDYPADRLRIYVVDDASTDQTPDVVIAKGQENPGQVVHLRRKKGGEGKAHTLNHGLKQILANDWMQALLIMDADVIYEPDSLRKMTRHFADPEVGAVTAYIKEGSRPANWMKRFIAYEYITAQAAVRRSQNVLGAMACLAGGAQLHTRANLEKIGGQIDTSSLGHARDDGADPHSDYRPGSTIGDPVRLRLAGRIYAWRLGGKVDRISPTPEVAQPNSCLYLWVWAVAVRRHVYLVHQGSTRR